MRTLRTKHDRIGFGMKQTRLADLLHVKYMVFGLVVSTGLPGHSITVVARATYAWKKRAHRPYKAAPKYRARA